ncbi:DUF1120 domain-containing protein [Pseudomonas sp. NPDC098747]|uniref:DUF1120 domain-containing protein n=1 Tax=Pseudomonas sp. NPDC098747 TaxID=3364487 RepID=UPI00383A5B37
MKKFLLLPLALAFVSNAAMAANSVDLRVTGTITPPACSISMPGGGDFDFGEVSMNAGEEISLTNPAKKALDISCSGLTLVGITAADNKPNTESQKHQDLFGIGVDANGNAVGTYKIAISDLLVNTLSGFVTRSADSGVSWNAPNPSSIKNNASSVNSWNSSANSAPPEQITSVSQNISITTQMRPIDTIDTSQAITLDGSATIELVYL